MRLATDRLKWLLPIVLVALLGGPAHADATSDRAVEKAHLFLAYQHDLGHKGFYVYDDRDSGNAHFYPSGWMGDLEAVSAAQAASIFSDNWTTSPYRGTTCIRVAVPANLSSPRGWAGVYWLFPDNNWDAPAYDLSRYVVAGESVRLTFWARGRTGRERVEFLTGGLTPDTVDASTGTLQLTSRWRQYAIDLTGSDLGNVTGGFAWVVRRADNPSGATFYLDDICFEFGAQGAERRQSEPRFVLSYVAKGTESPDRYLRNTCFAYDNALYVMACCARGNSEDMRRAKLVCDAFLLAQQHDPFRDGRIRNGYQAGDVLDPSQDDAPRLPGRWDDTAGQWFQDEYAISSDTGNAAWTALGLMAYWQATGRQPGSPYLAAAVRIGNWIEINARSNAGAGGYTGGVALGASTPQNPTGQQRARWKSSEHNIDLVALFAQLGAATGRAVWFERSAHAKRFLDRMYDPVEQRILTGTGDDGRIPVRDPKPMDVAPWAMLALRDVPRHSPAVIWARDNCSVGRIGRGVRGVDFNNDRDGVWYEGTAQMSLALRAMGDLVRADDYIKALRGPGASPQAAGAVRAASKNGLTTGFTQAYGPWLYFDRAHVGATCWHIFAERRWNPYWSAPVSPGQL